MADSGEKGVGCASVMRQARKVAAACWRGAWAAHSWKKWRGRGLVPGIGGVGGRRAGAAMRDRDEGAGSQGVCLVGAGAGGGAGACTPLEGRMTGGGDREAVAPPAAPAKPPRGAGSGQWSVTKGPRADPGKRDPGLRGDPAKRDQGARG